MKRRRSYCWWRCAKTHNPLASACCELELTDRHGEKVLAENQLRLSSALTPALAASLAPRPEVGPSGCHWRSARSRARPYQHQMPGADEAVRLQLVVSEASQMDDVCVRVLLTPSPTVLQPTPMRHLHHRIPSGTAAHYFEQCAGVTLSRSGRCWPGRHGSLAVEGSCRLGPTLLCESRTRIRCGWCVLVEMRVLRRLAVLRRACHPQALWLKSGPPRLLVCAVLHHSGICLTGDCGRSSSKAATTADRS